MTGATVTGIALPVTAGNDHLAAGSLHDAIFHLSKNQSDLNLMFKEVIEDFQVRLIENQQLMIDQLAEIGAEMFEIRRAFQEMTTTMISMQKVISEKINLE
jgi:hypothetical protein